MRYRDPARRLLANGVLVPVGPEDIDARELLESLIHDDYERCHPGDRFEDLKRRACFSKEDRALLKEWMELAACRVSSRGEGPASYESRAVAAE